MEKILATLGLNPANCILSQFHSDEDGSAYHVWRVDTPEGIRVLKKAKGMESYLYRTYFAAPNAYAPCLYATAQVDGATYLLLEYIPGRDLRRATQDTLALALDALIAMQATYWQAGPLNTDSLQARKNRRSYLYDPILEQGYDAYLAAFLTMPTTLCHDDLLPFNIIISRDRAVMIDWEVGGMLPYPTSLARLIAHSSEDEDAFFYMEDRDKAFAIDYYYRNFIAKMGIERDVFERDLGLCLLYEYCEWVYVGNKYPDADETRYQFYLKKAKNQAELIR